MDYNWYTKRALLSQLYLLTELFLIQDTSPGFIETRRFLDRRLHDILSFGMTLNQTRNMASAVVGGLMSIVQSLIPYR